MAISERERLELYEQLGRVLGPDNAGRLMELLPPTGWDDIATKADVRALGVELRGELSELRGEIGRVEGTLRAELGARRKERLGRGVAPFFSAGMGYSPSCNSPLLDSGSNRRRTDLDCH